MAEPQSSAGGPLLLRVSVEGIADLPLRRWNRPRSSVGVRVLEVAPPGDGPSQHALPATYHFVNGVQDTEGNVGFRRGEFFQIVMQDRQGWSLRFEIGDDVFSSHTCFVGAAPAALGYAEIGVQDLAREPAWNLLLQDVRTRNAIYGTDTRAAGKQQHVRRPTFLRVLTRMANELDPSVFPPAVLIASTGSSVRSRPGKWRSTCFDKLCIPGSGVRRPRTDAKRTRVMMITRGTRGDVQPFVALARGLILPPYNCEVCIATELFWKDFVKSARVGLPAGSLTFRPVGGDTHFQTRTSINQLATWHGQHHDTIQTLVMSNQETNFFPSEGCCYRWAEEEAPDFIVFGITMVHVAMILSESLAIPIVGFLLQPSRHLEERTDLVTAVDMLMRPVRQAINSPQFNAVLTQVMERLSPTGGLSVNHLRRSRGLLPCPRDVHDSMRHYDELAKHKVPLIVPINPMIVASRMQEFEGMTFTDFIFLHLGGKEALDPQVIAFIQQARTNHRPVLAMTFSSMPVGERAMLKMAIEVCTSPLLSRPSATGASDDLRAAFGSALTEETGPSRSTASASLMRPPPATSSEKRRKLTGFQAASGSSTASSERGPAMIVFVGGQEHDPAPEAVLAQAASLEREGRLLLLRRGQPFGLLFPELDAVIGQGGLGVTSEALIAGIPIITSGILLLDQRWWAARVHEMGCGSKGIRIQRLMDQEHAEAPPRIVFLVRKALGILGEAAPFDTPLSMTSMWPQNAAEVGRRLREACGGDGVAQNAKAVFEAGTQVRATIVDGFVDQQAVCGSVCRQARCCARCIWFLFLWLFLHELPAVVYFFMFCFTEFLCCGPCRRSCRWSHRRWRRRRQEASRAFDAPDGAGFPSESGSEVGELESSALESSEDLGSEEASESEAFAIDRCHMQRAAKEAAEP